MGTSPNLIRVLSVDGHALVREGIAALIANHTDMCLVADLFKHGANDRTHAVTVGLKRGIIAL
jgi:hypothetical protein